MDKKFQMPSVSERDMTSSIEVTMETTDESIEASLRALALDVLKRVQELGEPLESYKNKVAFFDPLYDERFTGLVSFQASVTSVDCIAPEWARGESKRLVLQFIYTFLNRIGALAFDPAVFAEVWSAFRRELSTTAWTYLSVANLQNFNAESAVIELGEGLSIRDLSQIDFQGTLGWGETQRRHFIEDRGEISFMGPHSLFVEGTVEKAPENFISANDTSAWNRAQRGILSLRLLKRGEVGMGRLFHTRVSSFNVGLGGMSFEGFSVRNPGLGYQLRASEIPSVQALFGCLLRFDHKYIGTWGNIALGDVLESL
jgi:hypothetical protein